MFRVWGTALKIKKTLVSCSCCTILEGNNCTHLRWTCSHWCHLSVFSLWPETDSPLKAWLGWMMRGKSRVRANKRGQGWGATQSAGKEMGSWDESAVKFFQISVTLMMWRRKRVLHFLFLVAALWKPSSSVATGVVFHLGFKIVFVPKNKYLL